MNQWSNILASIVSWNKFVIIMKVFHSGQKWRSKIFHKDILCWKSKKICWVATILGNWKKYSKKFAQKHSEKKRNYRMLSRDSWDNVKKVSTQYLALPTSQSSSELVTCSEVSASLLMSKISTNATQILWMWFQKTKT